ncbi:MAG TPA: hypothetical protein V6C90_08005 [Coleofasciculaceae cyanobacterium]
MTKSILDFGLDTTNQLGLSINQPGGTGLLCRLSRIDEAVAEGYVFDEQVNLFDNFRATENPDLSR